MCRETLIFCSNTVKTGHRDRRVLLRGVIASHTPIATNHSNHDDADVDDDG